MPQNVLEIFKERGFLKQCSSEDEVQKLCSRGPCTAYIRVRSHCEEPPRRKPGADHGPDASAARRAQADRRGGRRNRTIGDPSGKTEQRKLLTRENLRENFMASRRSWGDFWTLRGERHSLSTTPTGCCRLNYIEFLREIGRHFSRQPDARPSRRTRSAWRRGSAFSSSTTSCSRRTTFWCCSAITGAASRWAATTNGGTSCRHRTGSPDRGRRGIRADLSPARQPRPAQRWERPPSGAIWLDGGMTSPYDYYQYWVNADDRDVGRFLGLFTFLPMDEVRRLVDWRGRISEKPSKCWPLRPRRFATGNRRPRRRGTGRLPRFREPEMWKIFRQPKFLAVDWRKALRQRSYLWRWGCAAPVVRPPNCSRAGEELWESGN